MTKEQLTSLIFYMRGNIFLLLCLFAALVAIFLRLQQLDHTPPVIRYEVLTTPSNDTTTKPPVVRESPWK